MRQSRLTNLIQLYGLIEQSTTNTIERHKGFNAIVCPNSSWPNMIYEIDTDPLTLERRLDSIQKKVAKKELPPYCMLDAKLLSKQALKLLKSVALENRYWDYMEINLDKAILPYTLQNFKIKQAQTSSDILDWVETMENSIMKGRKLDPELFLNLSKNDAIEYYLGLENETPVAGSMLFKNEKIAGIYMIGTLNKFQRKGYGSAVTQQVLKRGFELNCKKAVLQATQAGEKIYTKLGFSIKGKIELFNLQLKH